MVAEQKALQLASRAPQPVARYEAPDIFQTGEMLARSGYFQDARDAAQTFVKILAGRELGIGDIAAMTGIYIVKGRVTLSANLMAALVKRSGRYNYRVVEMTDKGCEIEFFEDGQPVGRSSFHEHEARAAGLTGGDNWKKFPRNMYFARAMSNGVKWYCPDVSMAPIYTPDELGAQVDGESGEVIEARAETAARPYEESTPAETPKVAPLDEEALKKRAKGLVTRGLVVKKDNGYSVSDGAIRDSHTYLVTRGPEGHIRCTCPDNTTDPGVRCLHIVAVKQFIVSQQQPAEPPVDEGKESVRLRTLIYNEFARIGYSAEDIGDYMRKNEKFHGGTVLEVMSIDQLLKVMEGLEIK
ncbi:MAG TPA: hypothetical protein VF297_05065 [Pyrinomonadaceae bacterium]